jgi:hypothetical protein
MFMNCLMTALFHRTGTKGRRWVKSAMGESANFEYEILE